MGPHAILVRMPKAAVNKKNFLSGGKENVRSPGEPVVMEAISITIMIEESADSHFWQGVPSSNVLHVLASGGSYYL